MENQQSGISHIEILENFHKCPKAVEQACENENLNGFFGL